jgi:hypothetical protein
MLVQTKLPNLDEEGNLILELENPTINRKKRERKKRSNIFFLIIYLTKEIFSSFTRGPQANCLITCMYSKY